MTAGGLALGQYDCNEVTEQEAAHLCELMVRDVRLFCELAHPLILFKAAKLATEIVQRTVGLIQDVWVSILTIVMNALDALTDD